MRNATAQKVTVAAPEETVKVVKTTIKFPVYSERKMAELRLKMGVTKTQLLILAIERLYEQVFTSK